MLRYRLTMTICLLGLALTVSACDKEKTQATAAGGEEATEETAGEKAEETKTAAAALTAPEFTSQFTASLCDTYDTCKNEELKTAVGGMLHMLVGMGTMAEPELAPKVEAIGAAMEAEGRTMHNKADCLALFGLLNSMSGMEDGKVTAAIAAGTVTFDADVAQACLTRIKAPIAACQEEKKVEGEMQMSQVEAILGEHSAALEAQFGACETVFVGKIENGKECNYAFECAGEGACVGSPDAPDTKTCQG